jgi:transposase
MLSFAGIEHVYLECGSTDLRRSIDGLAVIVSQVFKMDPFAPCLFVFCNRRRDKLKILYWDLAGFWLLYRRLEKGRFQWPAVTETTPKTISRRQLQWLLDGLELEQKQAYTEVTARTIV